MKRADLLVIVTRPEAQSAVFVEALHRYGISTHSMPLIRIETRSPDAKMRRQCADLVRGAFNWILFTSVNSVRSFKEILSSCGAMQIPPAVRVAVQGSATARALADSFNRTPDYMPHIAVSENFAHDFLQETGASETLLLVTSARSRGQFLQLAKQQQRSLDVLYSHDTSPAAPDMNGLQSKIAARQALIAFFSPSAVAACIEAEGGKELLTQLHIATIGPVTSAAVRAHGLPVRLESDRQEAGAFAAAISALSSAEGWRG